jgi:hypothetical protein|tara:strand:- start:40 stop:612 length:573 start_codon:yes stop_codon:yes gene_type:complete
MKKLLAIIILSLCFMLPSQADDIRDFQIEGISIGDSLLDYFDKNQINSRKKMFYLGDDNFHKINFYSKKSVYELINFHLKKNDNKFVVYSMAGRNIIEFNECLEIKKIAIKEVKDVLGVKSENNYISDYRKKYGKSFSNVTELKIKNGLVRIYCDNWSDKYTKKNNWKDSFNIAISSQEFINWLENKAYK